LPSKPQKFVVKNDQKKPKSGAIFIKNAILEQKKSEKVKKN
jgi:hypothetical protein